MSVTLSGSEALDRWERETFAFLAAQNWAPNGSVLLLAVSGGADSTALLHFWARHAPRLGCRLAVAHVNHHLRSSSRDDENFVAALCREFRIPLFTRDLVPASRPARESLEMWARRERYAFFAEAMRLSRAEWILTAHQRDDLVETIFQRLHRGTGTRGLRGIPFRRAPGIIRPFLNRSRADVLEFLRLLERPWREDETNADAGIDRNWFRHRFLPNLRAAEPGLDERIFILSMRVQEIGEGLDALEAQEGLLAQDSSGRAYLKAGPLREKMAAKDWEAVAFWIRKLLRANKPNGPHSMPVGPASARSETAPVPPVTKELLLELRRQWEQSGNRLRVPVGRTTALILRNKGIYCVELSNSANRAGRQPNKTCSFEGQKVILDNGVGCASWRWGDRAYTLLVTRFPRPRELTYPSAREGRAIFDADRFSCTLLIRTRKEGDRFSPLGVSSRSRKLKAYLNEEKIAAGMRDEIPMVVSGETLAWVAGYGISDFFKVSDTTTHILEMVLECRNP